MFFSRREEENDICNIGNSSRCHVSLTYFDFLMQIVSMVLYKDMICIDLYKFSSSRIGLLGAKLRTTVIEK